MKLRLLAPLLAVVAAGLAPAQSATENQLKGLKARAIGPAEMGGRISDIVFDPVSPSTYYVGFATSGVW